MPYSRSFRSLALSLLVASFTVLTAFADTPGAGFDPLADPCGYLTGNAPASNFGQVVLNGAGSNQACVDQSGYFYSDSDQTSKAGYLNTDPAKKGTYPLNFSWSSTSDYRPRVNFSENGAWQGYAKIEGLSNQVLNNMPSAQWLWFDWSLSCETPGDGLTCAGMEDAESYQVRTDLSTGITEGYAWNDYFGWIYFYQTLEVAPLPVEVSVSISTETPSGMQAPDEVTFQTAPHADGVDDWIVQVQFWDPLRQRYLGPEEIESLDIEYDLTDDSTVLLDQTGFTDYAKEGDNPSALLFGGDSPARDGICETSVTTEQESGEGHGFCGVLLDSTPIYASFIRSGAPTSNTIGIYGEELNQKPSFTDRLGCMSFYEGAVVQDACEQTEKTEVFFDRVDNKSRLELESINIDFKPMGTFDRGFVLNEIAMEEGQTLTVTPEANGFSRLQITPAEGDKELSFRPRLKVRDYYLVVDGQQTLEIPREFSEVELSSEEDSESLVSGTFKQAALLIQRVKGFFHRGEQDVQLSTALQAEFVNFSCSTSGLGENEVMLEVQLHDEYNDRSPSFDADEYVVAPEEGFISANDAAQGSAVCIKVAGPESDILGGIYGHSEPIDAEWQQVDELGGTQGGWQDDGSDATGVNFPGYYTLNPIDGHMHNYFRFDERVEVTEQDEGEKVEVDIDVVPRIMFDVQLAETGQTFRSPIEVRVEGEDYQCTYKSGSGEHLCDFPDSVLGGEAYTVSVDGFQDVTGTLPAFSWDGTQVVQISLEGEEPPYPASGDVIGDMVLDVRVTSPSDLIKTILDDNPEINYKTVYVLDTDTDRPVVETGNTGGTFFRVDTDGSGGIDANVDLGTVEVDGLIEPTRQYFNNGTDVLQSYPVGYGRGLCDIGGVAQECPSYEDVVFPSAEVLICDEITQLIFGKESCYIGGYLPRYSFYTDPFGMELQGTTIGRNEDALSLQPESGDDFSAVGLSKTSELRDKIFERIMRLTNGEQAGAILLNGRLLFAKQDVHIQEMKDFADRTVVCLGCDVYLEGNIGDSSSLDGGRLGVISFKQNGEGGNVYISPEVKELNVNIFADGSVFSDPRSYGGTIRGNDGVPVWPDEDTRLMALANQLYILGSIVSRNTLGDTDDETLGEWKIGGGGKSSDYELAREYDWLKLRQFRLCYGVDPLTGEVDTSTQDLCSEGEEQLSSYDPDGSGPLQYKEASIIMKHVPPSKDQVGF